MTTDSRGPWPTALKFLVVATLVMLAVQVGLNQPLQTPYAPQGIISFQLAATAESSQLILNSWLIPGHGWAVASLLSGLLLVVVYTTMLVMLTRYLLSDRPGIRERKIGRWVERMFIVAGVANGVEKVALLNNLNPPTDSMSLTATLLALVSYTGVLLGVAGLVVIRASRRHPLTPSEDDGQPHRN